MKHTVLARKWRPKKFSDLVGQDNSVKILTNILKNQRIHHAILLTGTRGVGKTTIARIIAKGLNCTEPVDGEPCTTCENCIHIDNGSFVDVVEIDAASNTGVDNIRELIDNAQYAPGCGKYKVYIIDEVHMLSKSAFNAMLKTLEEPPANVIFILATTDLQKVPPTILSRCLQLKLRNLLPLEIQNYLVNILTLEYIQFEIKALELIAVAAAGSMRDALSILDQAIAFNNETITQHDVEKMLGIGSDEVIYSILEALSNLNSAALMQTIKQIYASGIDLESILITLQQKLCELSISQLTPANSTAPTAVQYSSKYNKHNPSNDSIDTKINKFVNQISVNDVHLFFEIANLGIEQLKRSSDKYPVFVMTLLRMLAFNIGTDQQKIIALNQSNFKVEDSVEVKVEDGVETVIQSKLIEIETAIESHEKVQDTTNAIDTQVKPTDNLMEQQFDTASPNPASTNIASPDTALIEFNGDWFKLINQLKPALKASYTLIENAQLKSFSNSTFELIIDKRYESASNSSIMDELKQAFNKHFSKPIALNISFADNINHTLKEKNLQEKEEKQKVAEQSIAQDEYLIKILETFSAKIAPGSIKSI
ncbi:MAG: polymerase subunit gamma/tau [Pseudomonadota bacterium]|nr:polymerase subunit gamma/tau [Pseudomonadota bacterium]